MKKLVLVLLCIGLLSSPVSLMAATEVQKQAAIDAGLAWLASQQQADGSWNYGGYEQAATGAALLAFVEQKYKPLGWNGHDYTAVVTKATNYLLSTATQVDISSANWGGFKGTANSGIGLDWLGSGETTYTSGIVLPGLCRLTAGIVNPSDIISTTPANPAVDGLTYAQVIQRAVDLWVWGQTGPAGGNYDGGWRYVPNSNESDGSTSQWGAIALLFAQQVPGISVPAQTKTELQKWINYIQNPTDGSCGYTDPNGLSGILNDESKTGGLLTQMVFAGGGGSQSKALAYLNTNWKNLANNTWYGNFGNPYAMFAIYKGLELTIGLDAGTGTISNLNLNPGDVNNPNHGWNWWEDYCNWLVLNQNGNGSWAGFSYWTDPLSTAWDINILNGTIIAPPAAGTILGTGGYGDALIFPYYDVRVIGNPQDNYFAIINQVVTTTTYGGVAAKLRFREADKSIEVYDIDIWLSCDDVWVGLIRQDTTAGLAYLWSPDYVVVGATDTQLSVTQANNVVDPVTGALIGRPFLPSRNGLDNARSLVGYFEVIGEERTACKATLLKDAAITTVDRFPIDTSALLLDVPNQLTGYFYLVNVINGVAFGYDATAIANFSRTRGSLFNGPGALKPDLSDCEDTLDQLEFVLSKYVVSQGYSIESSIAAKFSAVLTFPTKHFHFAKESPYSINLNNFSYGVGDIDVRGLPWTATTANNKELISFIIWDRNEHPFIPPPGWESPPVESQKLGLPFEVNIVGLYTTSAATPNPRDNVGFSTGGFDSGWFHMDFPNYKCLPDGNKKLKAFNFWGNFFYEYVGLPAIGLVIQEFSNGNTGGAYGEFLPVFYYQNVNESCGS